MKHANEGWCRDPDNCVQLNGRAEIQKNGAYDLAFLMIDDLRRVPEMLGTPTLLDFLGRKRTFNIKVCETVHYQLK